MPYARPLITATLAAGLCAAEAEPTAQPLVDSGDAEMTITTESTSEVTGSARRLPATARETPQSMTLLPRAHIQTTGAFSLRDALRSATGVTMAAGEGGRTGDSLTIRGFAANSDTYLDGMKDNGQYFRDTFNLEQIEVLRGASALLFGRGASGGAVNSVTRKPDPFWNGEASATLGSYEMQRVSAGVSGPLAGETLTARVDGFVQDQGTHRAHQEIRRMGLAPSLQLDLGQGTTVLLQHLHQYEKSTMDYGIPYVDGRPADVAPSTYYGFSEDSFQRFHINQTTLTAEHRVDAHLSFRNITRLGSFYRIYRSEALGAVNRNAGTVARSQALRDSDQVSLVNRTEAVAKGEVLGRTASLVLGFEFGREKYRFRTTSSTGVPAAPLTGSTTPTSGSGRANTFDVAGVQTNKARLESHAGYAMTSLEVVDDWSLVLGGRWDRFRADYHTTASNTAPDVGYQRSDLVFSPRAGLVWSPAPTLSAYVSYATAFNPSAETFALNAATAGLGPEKTQTFEAGIKGGLLQDRVDAGLAVYRTEKTNARSVDPINTSVQSLSGIQRADGVEIDLTGRPWSWWTLTGGLALTKAKVVRSTSTAANQAGVQESTQGRRPVNTPAASGHLWTTWDVGNGVNLGGGVTGVSSRYGNSANTNKVPAYLRWDLTLTWATNLLGQEATVQANVFNLLDTPTWDTGSGNAAYPGTPRSGQLTVSTTF
jgi:catecholate siderophore receptor